MVVTVFCNVQPYVYQPNLAFVCEVMYRVFLDDSPEGKKTKPKPKKKKQLPTLTDEVSDLKW